MTAAEPIDLSPLSDDQLVALTAACCQEAVRRGEATEIAAGEELLSAIERRTLSEQAAGGERESARQLEAARVQAEARSRARAEIAQAGPLLSHWERTAIEETQGAAVRAEAERAEREHVAREARERAALDAARERETRAWATRVRLAVEAQRVLGEGVTLTVWSRDDTRRVYADGPCRIEYHHTGDNKHPPGGLVVRGLGRLSNERRQEIADLCASAATSWRSVRIDCDELAA